MVGADLSLVADGIVRKPKRLLFSLLGELMKAGIDEPVRAALYLDVLGGAGVAGPTARASLDRLVMTGYLSRERRGRSILYGLTPFGREVMHEAAVRVDSSHPFSPDGGGWTLVTFTVPEAQRGARQQVRAALVWEGFAPLRDGLWIAPGVVDLAEVLEPHRDEIREHEVVAFHAEQLPSFPVSGVIDSVWNLDALRASHELFIDEWTAHGRGATSMPAASQLIALGADWTTLLRVDPRLPDEYLGVDWPSSRSFDVYRQRRAELESEAHDALRSAAAPGRTT